MRTTSTTPDRREPSTVRAARRARKHPPKDRPSPGRGVVVPVSDKTTFIELLERVAGLAESLDSADPLSTANGSPSESFDSPAQARLRAALCELEPDVIRKLHAVMVAGREAHDLGAEAPKAAPPPGEGLAEPGPRLAEYLRGGHAIACSTGFDLEQPLTKWEEVTVRTLDDRAWLSFGRQLARSHTGEWRCLGVGTEAGGQELSTLYLRLADHGWWSFGRVLDRPSKETVSRAQQGKAHGRAQRVAMGPLESVATRSCAVERRALKRAMGAIRARLGLPLERGTK